MTWFRSLWKDGRRSSLLIWGTHLVLLYGLYLTSISLSWPFGSWELSCAGLILPAYLINCASISCNSHGKEQNRRHGLLRLSKFTSPDLHKKQLTCTQLMEIQTSQHPQICEVRSVYDPWSRQRIASSHTNLSIAMEYMYSFLWFCLHNLDVVNQEEFNSMAMSINKLLLSCTHNTMILQH